MPYLRLFKTALILLTMQFTAFAQAQTIQQEKMQTLSFMVGDWVGTSKSINEQETKSVPAYQKIQYKIDDSIITIDLLSETLLIHTVIYYDKEDDTYYYNPFYKSGAAKYRGKIIDGKFWVNFSDTRRIAFERLADGRFREHGEKFVDGKWQTYFEDTFKAM